MTKSVLDTFLLYAGVNTVELVILSNSGTYSVASYSLILIENTSDQTSSTEVI